MPQRWSRNGVTVGCSALCSPQRSPPQNVCTDESWLQMIHIALHQHSNDQAVLMEVDHVPRGDHSHWSIHFRTAAVVTFIRNLPEDVYLAYASNSDLNSWPPVPRGTWASVVTELSRYCLEEERSYLPASTTEQQAFGRTVKRLCHKLLIHGSLHDLPHPPRPVDPAFEATLEKMFELLMRGWRKEDVTEGWHIFHSLQEADEISPEFHKCVQDLKLNSYARIWQLLRQRHPGLGYFKIRYKAARDPERSCTGAQWFLGRQLAEFPKAYTSKDCRFADFFKDMRYRFGSCGLQPSCCCRLFLRV